MFEEVCTYGWFGSLHGVLSVSTYGWFVEGVPPVYGIFGEMIGIFDEGIWF
jgi:hypothetical protein